MRARPHLLLGLLITLVGCRAEPDPLPAELVAHRELLRVGGQVVPIFDREHPPGVRLAAATPLTAEWRPEGAEPRPLAIRDVEAGADVLVTFEVPPLPQGPARLRVVAADGRVAEWAARWARPLAERPVRAPIVALRRANPPDYTAALRALDALAADPALDPLDAAWVLGERARIARRRGRPNAAIEGMAAAADAYHALGRVTLAGQRYAFAIHYAMEARALDRVPPLLERLCAIAEVAADPDARARCARRRGLLARDHGRWRTAEAALVSASRLASRAALDTRDMYLLDLGTLYQGMGRYRDALAQYDRIPAERERRGLAWATNRAWTELRAMRAGEVAAEYGRLRRTFDEIDDDRPPDAPPAERINGLLNRAWVALLDGDRAEARALFDAVLRVDPTLTAAHPVFARRLVGELALAEGRPLDAGRAFVEARRRAERELGQAESAGAVAALHGLGRARRAAGDLDGALAAWREAMAMSRRLATRTALSTSHSAFLADRRALVADAAELLIERGRLAEAFGAIDAARAPTLRALAATARIEGLDAADQGEWGRLLAGWRRARAEAEAAGHAVELAPLDTRVAAEARAEDTRRAAERAFDDAFAWLDARRPSTLDDPGDLAALLPDGMALLAFARLGERVHVFWVSGGRVEHRAAPRGRAIVGDALSVWGDALGQVRRIYVVDGGLTDARALAARPVDGESGAVWGERVELVYLPYAAWLRSTPSAAAGPPLVIADPDGTLPVARAAARAVAATAGVEPLVGGRADREAVLARLDGARWVHFDGHGAMGRERPWDAHLGLAGGERLTLFDVLAARPRMGVVVLNGCETAAPGALSRVEALGLAEGFLLAGADAVLAADRRLGVDEAARVGAMFHARGGVDRPAAALRETITAMRAAGDDGWRGWRLFGVRPR